MKSAQSVSLADPGIPSPACELESLHGKLKLAESSPAQFDIHLVRAGPAEFRIDPVLHFLDLQGVERGCFVGVDGLLDSPEECPPQHRVAGRVPGLDEGLLFPGFRPCAVVGQRGAEGMDQLPVLPSGPQSQVHAKDLPFRGDPSDLLGQFLRQPREKFAIRDDRIGVALHSRGMSLAAEEIDDIDVGAVVQLLASQFAQRQDREGGFRDPAPVVEILRWPEAVEQILQGQAMSFLEEGVCQDREIPGRVR